MRSRAALALAAVALAGCASTKQPPPATQARATAPADRRPTAPKLTLCRALRSRVVGHVDSPIALELSGLARGPQGSFYAENDSGNAPRVLSITATGRVLGAPVITGATNTDWEDVATLGGKLLLADIGDNAEQRPSVTIWSVPEPAPSSAASAPATPSTLHYPDGSHDAEALIADPLRQELTIVTKGFFEGRAYRIAAGASGTMVRGPRIGIGLVTSGAISADGRIVALRSYDDLVVWRRRGREPVTRTLSRAPACRQDLAAEGQGEALELTADGRAAYTVPEGKDPALRRYAPR